MSRGPLEFVVIEFPEGIPGTRIGPQLRDLVDKGVIGVVDMLFVSKAIDGTVSSFELATGTVTASSRRSTSPRRPSTALSRRRMSPRSAPS